MYIFPFSLDTSNSERGKEVFRVKGGDKNETITG